MCGDLDFHINSLIYSGEKINGRAVVSRRFSAIKPGKSGAETGSSKGGKKRGKTACNRYWLYLAVKSGKGLTDREIRGKKKRKILWLFRDLEGVFCGGQCPFCSGLYLGNAGKG